MKDDQKDYKEYVSKRLAALTPVFAKASIGDFSDSIQIPDEDDEFTQLYTGVEIMLGVIRGQLENLNSLNTSLSEKVEELQFTKQRVEEEKTLYEAILESIGDGVVVTDKNLIITLMNYQAQLMLGITQKEARDKYLTKVLVAVDDKGNLIPEAQRSSIIALNQKKKNSINYNYLREDKTPLPVSVTTSPILLGGQTVGSIVVFKDRTKERKVEEMKNEFISLAAHQLRSPLSTMRWNIELFQKENPDLSAEGTNKIDSVYKNIQKMITLVNDMLSVSRIDQGKIEHVIEKVDITSVILEILDEVKVIAETKMVEISFTPPGEIFVQADKKKLRDVLSNLINNALKFNTPLGKVAIGVTQEDSKAVFEISDTGIGIPPTDQDHIYKKFYRASNAVLGQTPGTGLGLFLVKNYVEAWGGKVWFESPANPSFRQKIGKTDNPGSSFYLEFKIGGDSK